MKGSDEGGELGDESGRRYRYVVELEEPRSTTTGKFALAEIEKRSPQLAAAVRSLGEQSWLDPAFSDEEVELLEELADVAAKRAAAAREDYERPRFDRYWALEGRVDGLANPSLLQSLPQTPFNEASRSERIEQAVLQVEEISTGAFRPEEPELASVACPSGQGYLDAAPFGIDGHFALVTGPRAGGEGERLVVVERGWALDHRCLEHLGGSVLRGGRNPPIHHWHGTQALGVVAGVDLERGYRGIAPRIAPPVHCSGAIRDASGLTDKKAAILDALAEARRSDALVLIETEIGLGGTLPSGLPVEASPDIGVAIRTAVDAGITVVEAAGNGGNSLDRWVPRGENETGAILVGAATAGAPRVPIGNTGTRVDCFAWGERVCAPTTDDEGTATDRYSQSFARTSSAAAIVAGAALVVRAWARGSGPVEPRVLRDWLKVGGTALPGDVDDLVGVMPDLRAIHAHLVAQGRI